MATFFYFVALCVATSAGFPASHQADQMEHINPLEFYYPQPETRSFYQSQQANTPNAASARLENLDPNSEVEYIPGGPTQQQPPQQVPVAPNMPGLMPGQRVFFIHMPIPGLSVRPGPIGGYQPVFFIGTAPQGNTAYPANGYQNTLLLGPQVFNYPGAQGNPNYVDGVPGTNPYVAYRNPSLYQQVQSANGGSSLRLAQLVSLQGTQPIVVGSPTASEPQPRSQVNVESKEVASENQNNKQKSSRTSVKNNM